MNVHVRYLVISDPYMGEFEKREAALFIRDASLPILSEASSEEEAKLLLTDVASRFGNYEVAFADESGHETHPEDHNGVSLIFKSTQPRTIQ